jgi:hypothetical protein
MSHLEDCEQVIDAIEHAIYIFNSNETRRKARSSFGRLRRGAEGYKKARTDLEETTRKMWQLNTEVEKYKEALTQIALKIRVEQDEDRAVLTIANIVQEALRVSPVFCGAVNCTDCLETCSHRVGSL